MSLAKALLKDKQLVVLFGEHHRISRAFYAVYAPGAATRLEAHEFVEWIREELAREG